jgi:hypothetical protein
LLPGSTKMKREKKNDTKPSAPKPPARDANLQQHGPT